MDAPSSAFFQDYGAAHEAGIRGDDHPAVIKQLEQFFVAVNRFKVKRNVYASNRAVRFAQSIWKQLRHADLGIGAGDSACYFDFLVLPKVLYFRFDSGRN